MGGAELFPSTPFFVDVASSATTASGGGEVHFVRHGDLVDELFLAERVTDGS